MEFFKSWNNHVLVRIWNNWAHIAYWRAYTLIRPLWKALLIKWDGILIQFDQYYASQNCKRRRFVCANVCALTCTFIHSYFVVICAVGGGVKMVTGEYLIGKRGACMGMLVSGPCLGRASFTQLCSVSARFLCSEMLAVAPSSRLRALRPSLERVTE